MTASTTVTPRDLRDHLLASGRTELYLADAAELLGVTGAGAADALARLRRKGQFFSPHPGLYIPIPPEFHSWGVVPAMDFIHQLMTALGRQYYVALLSAAELHGAAHQRPQVFQVMVDRPVEDREFGRVKLRFYNRQRLHAVPTRTAASRTASVPVSTPAATALDLVLRPRDCGGISNVATVLGELAEDGHLPVRTLVDAADAFPLAAARRVGYLLEHLGGQEDLDVLVTYIRSRATEAAGSTSAAGKSTVLLTPGGPRRGPVNRRWGIVVNDRVEPDL